METIIFPGEAECYVESLQPFAIDTVGSQTWLLQHERVEKLNQQAVASATCQTDEFVKEYLITHDKVSVLVHNLITTEVWKEKVFPIILKKVTLESSFNLYMMMYHEAPIVTLLETVMYHSEIAEAAEDSILDLLDYCHRKVSDTLARHEGGEELYRDKYSQDLGDGQMKDLQRQKRDLDFCLSSKALTVLRYIAEHLGGLPLAVAHRMLNNLDVPALCVSLVMAKPWEATTDKGVQYKFSDNEWRRVTDETSSQLSKTDGQLWITLYHLLMDSKWQEKYEITDSRKSHLLKLRSFLTAVLIDQLPVLGEMQRYLEHLAIMEPPRRNTKDVLIEQVPEIYDNLMAGGKGKWKQIASDQLQNYLNLGEADLRKQAKRWMETYNFDVIENLVAPPKCVVCGQQAAKRCSQCHQEWYCRRECQVQHWPKHKTVCDMLKDPKSS